LVIRLSSIFRRRKRYAFKSMLRPWVVGDPCSRPWYGPIPPKNVKRFPAQLILANPSQAISIL
jgi:hypothetical protein